MHFSPKVNWKISIKRIIVIKSMENEIISYPTSFHYLHVYQQNKQTKIKYKTRCKLIHAFSCLTR